MQKLISTTPTTANIARILDMLAQTPEKLSAMNQLVSGEQARRPLRRGERSFVETMAHLIHVEARSSESILLALMIDEPLIPNVHPERDWGKLTRFDQLEPSELLAYFNIRRKVLLGVLAQLKEKEWARVVREAGKQRKESVYWRARGLALHEAEHLQDLENKLAGK
jgi:hypothetical protein